MRKLTQSLLLVLISFSSYGQTFRFNQYTTEDGISQDFIYSINQDKQGYLWVGTGEGLCKFDGKHFETFTTDNGLVEDVITTSYAQDGAQWFGHNAGGITKLENGVFQRYMPQEGIVSKINAIAGNGNKVYGISQNEGLFEIKEKNLELISNFDEASFYALHFINEENMLIGTDNGLLHLNQSGSNWKLKKKYKDGFWITDLSPSQEDGIVLMSIQGEGLAKIRLNEGNIQFSTWNSEFDLSELDIKEVVQDVNMNIWIGTYGEGMIKLRPDTAGSTDVEVTKYNIETGMSSNYVQSVFEDREGNIWVGTFGNGLSTLIDDYFTFYSHDPEKFGTNVTALWVSGHESWFGVDNGLIRISRDLDSMWTFYDGSNQFVDDVVTSLYYVDSTVWIGTRQSGVWRYDFKTDKIEKFNWGYGSLQRRINQITGGDGTIWIATEGGLIVYYNGSGETNLFDTQSGLAHNSIKSVCMDSEGVIWMGTHSRTLYGLKDFSMDEFDIINAGELELISITEDSKGHLWIATAENGVYEKLGSEFIHYSAEDGLKSNYTYSVHEDINGNVWVGHRGALSKISKDRESITVYDQRSGITEQANPRAMFQDDKAYLWIGTDGGAIKYDPSKDRRKVVAPVVNLLSVVIDEDVYPVGEDVVLPYGDYRVHFNFIGISFRDPDKVKYKFKLEGHDKEFLDFTHETYATYGSLVDGKYEFKVIACNEEDVCSEDEATFKLHIKKPFWKQIWFYFAVAIAIISIVLLIVRARIKRFQANQRYLEEQLAIKTKEVVEKAEIIQEINKDMTASINYAERIQHSILPKLDRFQELFPDSFIFFRPRDIVSGDFYFMREYRDKFIIACVDCTGHGVPGAFMSMIGSTTLRNIYKLMERTGEWLTPEKVLDQLDEEVQKILHQSPSGDQVEDFFKSRDGMDMTLVEIDKETKRVLISSAKRHSFVIQKGEITLHSGDKRPIGGGDTNQVDFTLQELEMSEGDSLFLFSDGYPDQFGGKDSRKLKLSGVKKIIEGLSEMDKSQYENSIESNFNLWKSDKEQIDDVLMIGILF